ncbi:MAG: Anti-sigma-28 factor, FlgM [Blastocatellia bacterium]|jgi:flagellar biosynthesis anti-sigma factor FlgM|nr:Anti-sigma-28 factor, FlgM [Blastocatellia bacterium]
MKVKLNGSTDAKATRVKNIGLAHPKSDEIQVSSRGATVQKLVERSSSLPGLCQDKVDAVRARIDSGSYNPSSLEIADGMIREGGIRSDYLTGHVEPESVIAWGWQTVKWRLGGPVTQTALHSRLRRRRLCDSRSM